MGQYGNQPDFATIVETVSALPMTGIQSGAIYIGALTDTEADVTSITVRPVGNSEDVTFSGISAGTFLPVIVTKITSAINIPESSILLIY
jgi:hypothetical protein